MSPGEGVDADAEFSEWDIDSLRARVKLVREFDELAKACKNEYLTFCREFDVQEEEILVPKKVKRLVEK